MATINPMVNKDYHGKVNLLYLSILASDWDVKIYIWIYYNPQFQPNGFYWGHQCSMNPHPSQQHAGPQNAVLQPQQEVTRPKARFKHTLPEKSGVDGGRILASCL